MELYMNDDQYTMKNPLHCFPVPPFQQKPLHPPGLESEMNPLPDYGERSYRGSGRLKGRRALVTGGDSGIGRAVALAFAREGADVAIAHMPEEQKDGDSIIALLRSEGFKAISFAVDLRNEEACLSLISDTQRELGGIDILVNNAAYQMSHENGILDISTEEFDRTLKTNLYAMFWLTKAVLPIMAAGATVINTSSIEAYQPDATLAAYAMTKGAIVNFTKGVAQQSIERGIRVNSVAPGPVWTPLIPATLPPEAAKNFGRAQSPMKRPAQPIELAPAYVFLASQESSYVNGHILGVTGGTPTN
jgi:NAD(P)-dependent dehydrogenase (short-subunit alcohol dehydrogenase family)